MAIFNSKLLVCPRVLLHSIPQAGGIQETYSWSSGCSLAETGWEWKAWQLWEWMISCIYIYLSIYLFMLHYTHIYIYVLYPIYLYIYIFYLYIRCTDMFVFSHGYLWTKMGTLNHNGRIQIRRVANFRWTHGWLDPVPRMLTAAHGICLQRSKVIQSGIPK